MIDLALGKLSGLIEELNLQLMKQQFNMFID